MTHKDIRTVVEKYISNSSDIGSIPQSPAYTTESELESVNNEDSSNLDEMIRNQLICFEVRTIYSLQIYNLSIVHTITYRAKHLRL